MILKELRAPAIRALNLVGQSCAVQPNANITGRGTRGCKAPLQVPYDYKKHPFYYLYKYFDGSITRLTPENAKIVVVEGPIAAGKTAFAKYLAEELDMKLMPAITIDDYYINQYGYDLRAMDPELPESCKSYDLKDFNENPTHYKAASFQIIMATRRYSQYVDALAHVFNTGQGVVLERSYYSDFGFAGAMHEVGYLSSRGK